MAANVRIILEKNSRLAEKVGIMKGRFGLMMKKSYICSGIIRIIIYTYSL